MNSRDWLGMGILSLTVGALLIALTFVPPLYLLATGVLLVLIASVLLAKRAFDTGPLLYLLTSGILAAVISVVPSLYIDITGAALIGLSFLLFLLAHRTPARAKQSRRTRKNQAHVVVHVHQAQWLSSTDNKSD